MKKIFNLLKTFLSGILPTIAGGLAIIDITYAIRNIQKVTAGSGWYVVYFFLLAVIELILGIILIYDLGEIQLNAKRWKKYLKSKEEEIVNNIDSSSCDCETSNEATGTSSETKSKGKRKKS